jgi:hypothetical protein
MGGRHLGADIVVPPGIVAGRRFVLTIHYQAGDRPPVAIERRVVQVGDKAVNVVRRTPLAGLGTGEPGTLRYPVAGLSGAARRTYLFTLIDSEGARSASTRVPVDGGIASAPAVACTRDTCGIVASIRAVARRYELTVRMDDRTVRTLTHARRVRVGALVRWSGGRLTELAALPTSRRTMAKS